MDRSTHRGAEHLIFVPDRAAAEEMTAELADDGFADVQVVHRSAAPDDALEWVVQLRDERLPEVAGNAAYEALRERFTAMAHEHGGRYDEPGDPRPAE